MPIQPGNSNRLRLSKNQSVVIATGFLGLFSIVGIMFYGLPFFYDFWVKDFNWSRAQVTSGNAIGKVIVGALGFLAGWIIDKSGPKRMMMFGILMGGLSLIGLSRMSELWQFYFFYFLGSLAYISSGPLPNQVLISRWFDKSRGKAMGFAYMGIAVGGMTVPFVANWLNIQFGWRDALLTLGILMIVISFPILFFLKENPETKKEEMKPGIKPVPFSNILKKRSFYLLALGSMFSISSVSGTVQNLKLYFSLDLHYTQERSAHLLSFVLFSSLIGRFLFGWLADRLPKKTVMMLIPFLVACAMPLLGFTDTFFAINLFAFIFGLCLGGDYMIIPLMAADLYGVKILGRVMGLILTADGLGEAFSPILAGWMRDKTGSYMNGFYLLMVSALLSIVCIALIKKDKEYTH